MGPEKSNTDTGSSSSRSPLGLNQGELYLSPYRDEWPKLFETEKKSITTAIGNQIADIQHVGSTAVPGMSAKPILDIAIAVRNFETARACIEPLLKLGYTFKGENGIPRRHYFQKGEPCTHHIHMVEETCEVWAKLIQFRNFLRSDRSAAEEYGRLKTALVDSLAGDRKAYLAAKAEFITEAIKESRATRRHPFRPDTASSK